MSEEQDLNITDISSEKTTHKLRIVANRINPNESCTFEGDVMESINKGNKRSAEDDNTVTIEKFLKSKRLRRTLTNEEEDEADNGGEGVGDAGEYSYQYGDDEEMVIVVVQNEGENALHNEYGQLENAHFEEEVAYHNFMNESEGTGNFINEREGTANFMNESEGTGYFMNESGGPGVEGQPMLPSDVQQQQINDTSKESTVERKIIGTKSLTVRKELCRLCLSKHSNMHPLFETTLTFVKSSLKDVIESCIGIKVLREDATDRICKACISRLESIWAFREQCENSNRLVKQMKRIKIIQGLGDRNQNSDADDNLCNNEPLYNKSRGPRQFFCNNCNRNFYTEVALAAHVTNDHAHLKPFTQKTSFLVSCSVCGRKVLKKVLHDHYLSHKLLGEDLLQFHWSISSNETTRQEDSSSLQILNKISNNSMDSEGKNGMAKPASYQEVEEVEEEEDDDDDEEDIDDVDDVEDDEEYGEGEEEIEEGEFEDGEIGAVEIEAEEEAVTSFADLEENETLDGEQISGILHKENDLSYDQNECFVTDITGSEFINVSRVEGEDIVGGNGTLEDPEVIAVRINEDVQSGTYGETSTPQYTQVYLVDQAENMVETSVSQENNVVENNLIQDGVSTATLDENHIYVVTSDAKSMYVDNQDVVFQIANDQVYHTDTSGGLMLKEEVEVVYQNTSPNKVLVKEEVIDPSYDQ